MSEYNVPGAASRLIGDRWSPEGVLTSRVRAQPFCVVLLDEVEKADPSVLNLMLQLFDDGRLSDASGEVADFRHAVVIMTSNLGAGGNSSMGFGAGLGRSPNRDPPRHRQGRARVLPARAVQPDRSGRRIPPARRGRGPGHRPQGARPAARSPGPDRAQQLRAHDRRGPRQDRPRGLQHPRRRALAQALVGGQPRLAAGRDPDPIARRPDADHVDLRGPRSRGPRVGAARPRPSPARGRPDPRAQPARRAARPAQRRAARAGPERAGVPARARAQPQARAAEPDPGEHARRVQSAARRHRPGRGARDRRALQPRGPAQRDRLAARRPRAPRLL